MKKKIKIAAGFLTVIFCILLGCERREREPETLFLEEEELGDFFQEEAEAEEVFQETSEDENSAEAGGQQSVVEPESCVVHICGAVNEPGVYTLEGGARIYQAIEKAGGFREDAEQEYLNQADLLVDGMKIYVPTQEEAAEVGGNTEWMASAGEVPEDKGQGGNTKDAGVESSLVNINTAGEEQLCTLPGVGSSKAKSIIAYREQNGAYKTIEDIMNVEGIKNGVFRKIKDCITV